MECMQLSEYLYKTIIYHIHRFIIPVYIPENNFQAIPVVPLVKRLLIGLVLLNAARNYFVEEFQCSSLLRRYAVTVETVALHSCSFQKKKNSHRCRWGMPPATAGNYSVVYFDSADYQAIVPAFLPPGPIAPQNVEKYGQVPVAHTSQHISINQKIAPSILW